MILLSKSWSFHGVNFFLINTLTKRVVVKQNLASLIQPDCGWSLLGPLLKKVIALTQESILQYIGLLAQWVTFSVCGIKWGLNIYSTVHYNRLTFDFILYTFTTTCASKWWSITPCPSCVSSYWLCNSFKLKFRCQYTVEAGTHQLVKIRHCPISQCQHMPTLHKKRAVFHICSLECCILTIWSVCMTRTMCTMVVNDAC